MAGNQKFFIGILLPSLVAILLFLIAVYLLALPKYRESLMDKKRETIRELTNTAWSIIQKQYTRINIDFTKGEAQAEAARIISELRYGPQMKDYFWINDTTPIMIAHPYRPMLVGINLSSYRDLMGRNLFIDIVSEVSDDGTGYVEYYWQWKDDTLTIAPKLSYVKLFEPWGWIVGTGIYIDDVNQEIEAITRNILWISIAITFIIAIVIAYLARRNFVAEMQRRIFQEKLRESMERYKKLVEASTDGVLMIIDKEIVYCNPYLLNLLEFSQGDFEEGNPLLTETIKNLTTPDDIQNENETTLESSETIVFEKNITTKERRTVEVVISRSLFEVNGKKGLIYAIKDLSDHKVVERELGHAVEKLKSVAGVLNLGVFRCTVGRRVQFIEINTKALQLLGYDSFYEIAETNIQDLFEDPEEKREIFKAINEGLQVKEKLIKIKRGTGEFLSIVASLFPVFDNQQKVVYCDGIIADAYDSSDQMTDFRMRDNQLHLPSNFLLQPAINFSDPALNCPLKTSIATASKLLVSGNAEVLLVTGPNKEILGMVTHTDISKRAFAEGMGADAPVSRIMSSPVPEVLHDDLALEAQNIMIRYNIPYVVVKTIEDNLYRYVSLLRLTKSRKDSPEFLAEAINKADSVPEINQAMSRLPRFISSLVGPESGLESTGKLISKLSDAITIKLIGKALSDLGPPPCPFVFLALGSEGRKEQTLATDQDNAIVYKLTNLQESNRAKEYFLRLGSFVCENLSMVGYPLCKGGIMAMNDQWCGEMEDWKTSVSHWINIPNPKELLNVSIFFDFRPVFGDMSLASELNTFCKNNLKLNQVFFYNLAQSIVSVKLPNLDAIRRMETFDVKSPIFVLTSLVRFWALTCGISKRNTLERLAAINMAGAISQNQKDEIVQVFSFFTHLRVTSQLRQLESFAEANNHIFPGVLSPIEKLMIKKGLDLISDIQSRLILEYKIS
ncbi:MAG TPA: DUF294 nucleotidyltransferase-like domain-containing protein [Bacteroidales bacterium]|nr:DUF294 nucleotidyltransferase-like domain-containing protein [Bacteroidales bacterium]